MWTRSVIWRAFSRAAEMSGKNERSALRPGNRSSMSDRNSGTSSATNLLMFMSRSVRIMWNTSLLRARGCGRSGVSARGPSG